jgi:polysaccharide pyruvyl transferase WcaK-like protein
LSRHGDSLKLRICTAILKDLYPSANLFCMDRIECIDQEELAKYVNYYSKENNDLQYFVTLVGKLDFALPHNALAFKLDKFKVM